MDKKEKIFQQLEHGGNSSKLNIFSGLRNEESSVFSNIATTSKLSASSQTELAENLLTLIETLPDKIREVIELHYFENKTIHDIKATIGMSESTVRNRLGHGLFLLKKKMAEKPKGPV